jgi:hypothetical protein
MTRDDSLAWMLGTVVIVGVLINAAFAEGQTVPDFDPVEVALGQLAVNEGTWSTADAEAIAYARDGWSLARLRAAHRRALDPDRSDRRRWIAGLRGDGVQPAHWPATHEWDRYRERWLSVLAAVRRVRDGHAPTFCTSRPQSWGGRTVDADRLARIYARGGREVCTGTRNAFIRFGGAR